jgi:hypothetical protein
MQQKKAVACASAVLLALAVACSKSPETPVSPSSAEPGGTAAGPNGETLKAKSPTPESPVNGAQPDTLVLTAGKSSGSFDQGLTGNYSYEFQIMNAGNTLVCSQTVPGGSGGSVSWTPSSCNLELDANHTWRVRATTMNPGGQMANGPWSSAASFKSPVGGYIRGDELYDPLYNGKTVAQPQDVVNATFIPDQGLRLNGHTSRVTYVLPVTLQAGEMSVMVLGADEGNPGDKTKIFSMQERFGDITTNDYRMTAELRGRDYVTPGAIQFRIITGDAGEEDSIHDSPRIAVPFSSSRWYFWKFTWRTGRADLVVREDGPRGRVLYNGGTGTGDHPYRPEVHVIHLGAPVGRAGPQDASHPGAIFKNFWVSARPRPAFAGE